MNNMSRRNGNLLKGVVVSATLLCGVYFIYIFNNTSGKLKSTERIADRYRREQESLRTQLQELTAAKDDMHQRSENEKKEFINRLNTLNQHHKMLKSQHDDLQADYSRLQSEKEKDKEDTKLQEDQRNQEYMQLKQEKELEISSLRDQLANLGRDKEDLTEQVTKLVGQLKDSQQQLNLDRAVKRNLEKQNAAMKEKIRQQNLQLAQAQQAQKPFEQQGGQLQQQQQQQQPQQPQQGLPQQGFLQQNQGILQQNNPLPQLNQLPGQQAQQNLQFQPIQGQPPKQGFLMGNDNPLVGDHQQQGGDNLVAQKNQDVQEMQQQPVVGNHKISDNLMEQQQQQHQVQAPNLDAGQGDKNQYGGLKQLGIDPSQVKVKQDANAVLDAEQQQHQMAPPGEHIKVDKPDSNMAGEMDKNLLNEKTGKNKKHDSNQAGEMEPDPKADHQVGPAPPANDNVDPPNVADNPQQNIPPLRESLDQPLPHRNNDLLDVEKQGHQVAPPGGHIKVDKPDSNMAGEMDRNIFKHKKGKDDSNQAGEMVHGAKIGNHVGPAPPQDNNVDPPNIPDGHQDQHTPSPRHGGKVNKQKSGRRPRLMNQDTKFHFPRHLASVDNAPPNMWK
ncbi:putative mediator of RNA polymerase II transcription subunit 12 isoform X11 [Mizuhopecten yessoensis]|uniref:putative mediator of RNA polymerase II transcription subunit 12 isoform X11 n=1 Tax=Mizuhopecten yessoensis TaxID=6573 RepID=UPI000B45A2D8|nr:putative mediator of RNA polymerase II transcription subunit 12 isoform X11 [Mizuhopecten yessoensis]